MHTKNFKQLSYKNVDIAGGKGASLGEMTRAKMKIPPGFIVLAPTFDKFLEETDLNIEIETHIKKVSHQDINSVDRASNEIRDMILDSKMPKNIGEEIIKEFKKLKTPLVAVRSSATAEDSTAASWAGELETYLNVTRKNLLESVKKCWASLFTPRAIFYRYEKNMQDKKISVAVVIQKMVQSEISGICFTVHPVTCDKNQLVIEAGYGLGEAIVGGMITPDTYVIHKNKGKAYILDKNISSQGMMIIKTAKGTKESKVPSAKQEKQKLTDAQILKLTKICLEIEKHYKKPQDIEWAIEKGKIYITQSRPITTLG
ncbi:MAG: PEP/pyruvate-binding domain-containing protein [bacterium]